MFTDFIANPKNVISFTGISCEFFEFITKPKFCNKKINVSFACNTSFNISTITSMSSKNIIILTLFLFIKVIGICRSFVKIRGTRPRPKHKHSTNFLRIENEYIFMSFCLEVCENKHLLDLIFIKNSCSWRRSFIKCIPSNMKSW